MPSVLSEQLAWDLPRSDMIHLASLLAGSAMCINSNSTLCLDACMLDRPVINIAFDGWEELPYEKSARRGLNYIHMAKLLALGGIRIAKTFADLETHINAYLRDPQSDRCGRMLSVAQECGPKDGRAVERVAQTLLQLADRRQSAQLKLIPHSAF
jgi:CDP-glycerol glycerophosphotransferase (TagB/SpsB family)